MPLYIIYVFLMYLQSPVSIAQQDATVHKYEQIQGKHINNSLSSRQLFEFLCCPLFSSVYCFKRVLKTLHLVFEFQVSVHLLLSCSHYIRKSSTQNQRLRQVHKVLLECVYSKPPNNNTWTLLQPQASDGYACKNENNKKFNLILLHWLP